MAGVVTKLDINRKISWPGNSIQNFTIPVEFIADSVDGSVPDATFENIGGSLKSVRVIFDTVSPPSSVTVDVKDYDYQFEIDKINKFNILIENRWNTRISPVFADVTMTDNGKVMANFKTVSVDTDPWEVKNISGYFDSTGMEAKRYLASIKIKYADSESHKLVAIYLQEPPKEGYAKYETIASSTIAMIIAIISIFLILRIKKLEQQIKNNGKKD